MSLRLEKAWQEASPDALARLPGQLGVFQLGDADGEVIYIGFAGGDSPFGLRGEIERAVAACPGATCFRIEVNMQYSSRYRELLMLHEADRGELPAHPLQVSLGRLRPTPRGG